MIVIRYTVDKMDWSYIAGFFDGEGNLHINVIRIKNKFKTLQIFCRIYNVNKDILESIKRFIGFGKIYTHKGHRALELVISKKQEVKYFLEKIKDLVYLKKEQINYILKNFNFNKDKNFNFNLDEFRSFVDRIGLNDVRKNYNYNLNKNG